MNQRNNNRVLIWITALLLYLLLLPYFVWPIAKYFNWVVSLPLYIIFIYNGNNPRDYKYAALYGILSLLASFCEGGNILSIGFNLGLIFTFLINKSFMKEVYEKFRYIYIAVIGVSMLVMVLLALGFSLPYKIIEPVNIIKDYQYIAYPFLLIPTNSFEPLVRFCGVFDEPGVVGTMSFILLYIERLNFNRYGNIIILAAGLLSMSLFFYLALFAIIVFRIFSKKINFKSRLFYIAILCAGLFFTINNLVTQDTILTRVQWDKQEHKLSGDNRALDGLDSYVRSIKGTSAYYWGVKNANIINKYNNSASIDNAIIRYGIVVIVLYFIFYFFYARSYLKKKSEIVIFMIVLFMIMYNRPAFFDMSVLFLYNMALYKASENESLEEKIV